MSGKDKTEGVDRRMGMKWYGEGDRGRRELEDEKEKEEG